MPRNRRTIVQSFCSKYEKCQYLEIGIEDGAVFFGIKAHKKVGVDISLSRARWFIYGMRDIPEKLDKETRERNENNTYREMSSDQFFEGDKERFPGYTSSRIELYDVIFIDGNHSYEQSRNDALNALKVLAPGGTLILHDTNPRYEKRALPASSYEEAKELDPSLTLWNGEVWKTVLYLQTLPGIKVYTIAKEMGFSVVTKEGKPKTNSVWFKKAAHGIDSLTYDDLSRNRKEWLNIK